MKIAERHNSHPEILRCAEGGRFDSEERLVIGHSSRPLLVAEWN